MTPPRRTRLHGAARSPLNLDADAQDCSGPAQITSLCVTSAQDLAYVMYTSGPPDRPREWRCRIGAITRLVGGPTICESRPG